MTAKLQGRFLFGVLLFLTCLFVIPQNGNAQSDLLISGVIDGPLSGGLPKAVEFFVLNDIPDLSIYGFGSANNGGGSDGEEFSFPADAVLAGSFVYVATEATGFSSWFGFAPTYTSSASSINGDDAIELFQNGVVVDVFGDINVDGSGQPWEYLDGWTYRVSGTGPDGATFVLANWSFSGPNALDGESTNGTAARAFPVGTYTTSGGGGPATFIRINEVDSDTPGSDAMEFVELYDGGVGNTALDGLVVVFFNGSSDDQSYDAFDLDGFSTDANGFFLMGNSGVSPTPALIFGNGGLQNGADAVALYAGDAADFPNGTPVTASNIVDAIVYDTNDVDDTVLLSALTPGQPQVNEGGGGSSATDSNSRVPDGGAALNTSTYVQQTPTPGATNVLPLVALEIFEIQGSGAASPFVGQTVVTADNIVTAVISNGFFIQTPVARTDGDAATSDGVFVFTGSSPSVAVGDQVDVTGDVVEFFELTEISGNPTVTVDNSGNALPAAVALAQNMPSGLAQAIPELEAYEGMLVSFTGIATGPTDQFGDAAVVARTVRSFREAGIEFPGLPGLPVWDGNPEVFEVNPATNLDLFATQEVTATGPLTFSFGDYQLLPESIAVGSQPAFSGVRAVANGEVTVGSLNMLRLFQGQPNAADYQSRLSKFSAYIRTAMGAPAVLAVQEVEDIATLQDVAEKITADDASLNYAAHLVEGNDVGGIDVGFLVRSDVLVEAVVQKGKDEVFTFNSASSPLHDRPPLALFARFSNDTSIVVLNVHQRSLNNIDDPSDGARVRQKRHEQAVSVSKMVQAIQDSIPNVNLVVTGDFNAFQFSDGYVDVVGQIQGNPADPSQALIAGTDEVEPNLTNQILSLTAEEQYSFVFGGSAQVLDHMLTAANLSQKVSGIAFARGNADAPDSFDNDPSEIFRTSDHDGVVLFIDVTPPQILVDTQPAVLGTPNHKYSTFEVGGFVQSVDDPDLTVADVFITSVTSDEPENGTGDGNTTDDIVIVDCQTVSLRSERQGGANGRVYTIHMAVEDAGGNAGTASFRVHVPHDKKSTAIDDGPVYEVVTGCDADGGQASSAPAVGLGEGVVPEQFALAQNYPNPFNPETSIRFSLPTASDVRITVYNSLGQRIRTLVQGVYQAGVHTVSWDARNDKGRPVASGLYIYQINAGSFLQTRKMVLLR